MKKLLTILLALSCAACVLMFAACGTEEEPSDGSDANTTVSDGDAAEITTEGETPDVTTSPEGVSEEPVTTPSPDDTQNGTTATAPTVAIGVPTMADIGSSEEPLMVTPKSISGLIKSSAELIGMGINAYLQPGLTASQINLLLG